MPRGRPPKSTSRTKDEERELANQRQRKRRSQVSRTQHAQSHRNNDLSEPLTFVEYKPDAHPTITTGPFANFAACLQDALPPAELVNSIDDTVERTIQEHDDRYVATDIHSLERTPIPFEETKFGKEIRSKQLKRTQNTQLTQDSGVDVAYDAAISQNDDDSDHSSVPSISQGPFTPPLPDTTYTSSTQDKEVNNKPQQTEAYINTTPSPPRPGSSPLGEFIMHGAVAPGDETNHPILANHGEDDVVFRLPLRKSPTSPSTPIPSSPEQLYTPHAQSTLPLDNIHLDNHSPTHTSQSTGNSANNPPPRPSQQALATLIARHLIKPTTLIPCVGRHAGYYFRGGRAEQPGRTLAPRPRNRHDHYPNFCNMNGNGRSLRDWLDYVESGVPYLLDSKTLKKGQQLNTTLPQRQKLFGGQTFRRFQHDEPNDIPLLDFTEGLKPTEVPFKASFDVDSVIIIAKSIAIARGGLKVLTIQRALPPITSSLHLGTFPCQYHDTDDPSQSLQANLPIHKIPHFSLGRFAANDDMEIIIALPHAVRQGQKIVKLTDELYTIWMDEIFLPAVHDTLPASQSRVFPASHAEAKAKAILKSRTELKNDAARNAYLHYHIQPQYLDALWTKVNANIRRSGEHRFQDYIILVNAKGIKGGTSSSTWQGMHHKFHQRVLRHINNQHKLNAWYDVGKEWIYPLSSLTDFEDDVGQTALWSLKYINDLVGHLRHLFPNAPKSGITQHDYPSYFFAGLGATTIEPDEVHPLRENGLLYAQWYNTVKDLFAAGDHYLASNDAQADLGLDPSKIATLKHIAHAVATDHNRLIASYLHIKHHIHTLNAARQKSFSIREEYRIRDDLWEALNNAVASISQEPDPEEFSEDNTEENRELIGTPPPTPPGHGPRKWSFIPIPTRDFIRWVQFNINRFCIGIEHIFSTVPEGTIITWEQTRAISMFFTGIGVFVGSLTNGQGIRLWYDLLPKPKTHDPNAIRRQGMGMLKLMKRTGYPWFMPKLNWHTLTFKSALSDAMGFDRLAIEKRLWKHSRQLQGVRDLTSRVEGVYPLLCRFGRVAACRALIFHFLFQVCAHQLRLDTLAKMKPTIEPQFHDDVDSGSIPLSFDSLANVLVMGSHGLHIKNRASDWVKTWPQWCDHIYLDSIPQKSRNNAYHTPFASAKQVVFQAIGAESSREWQKQYFEYIRATNWILPYPQNHSFLAPWSDKARGEQRPWQVFAVANPEIRSALASLGAGTRLPLPQDWLARYSNKWTAHNTPYLRGIPELDVDLVDLTSTQLYLRVIDLAGSDFHYESDEDTDEEAGLHDDMEYPVTLPYHDVYDVMRTETRPPPPRQSARHKRGASVLSNDSFEEKDRAYQGIEEAVIGEVGESAQETDSVWDGIESEFEGFSTDANATSDSEP